MSLLNLKYFVSTRVSGATLELTLGEESNPPELGNTYLNVNELEITPEQVATAESITFPGDITMTK